MQDIDIYRAAGEMIKQHGQDATLEAAMKSDTLLAKGDVTGAGVWREITKRIMFLQAQKPDGVTEH